MTTLVPSDQLILGNLTVAGSVNAFGNQVATDPFGDIRTVSKQSIIDLKSTFSLSQLRDTYSSTGNGSVVNPVGNPEYTLTVTGNNDIARLQSIQRGKYVAGYGAEVGTAVRLSTGTFPVNVVARWGYMDDFDGFYFMYNNTGLNVVIRRGGVETVVNQSNFNVDKLDGTGASGVTFNPTRGNIFQIVFSWYGYGAIDFRIVCTDQNGTQFVQSLHKYAPSGNTSVKNPNLNIVNRIDCTNAASLATPIQMYVAGRQFSLIGAFANKLSKRTSSIYVHNASIPKGTVITQNTASNRPVSYTPFTSLVIFKRKESYYGNPIKIQSFDMISDQNLIYQIRVNPLFTVSGSNHAGSNLAFTDLPDTPASETAITCNTSQYTVTNSNVQVGNSIQVAGITIFSGYQPASTNQSVSQNTVDIDYQIEDNQCVTICATSLGQSAANVSLVLRLVEEW